MIQRIQTVWLFLAFLSAAVLFFLPLAEISQAGKNFELLYRGIYPLTGENPEMKLASIPLASINFLTALLSITSIFLFKKRKLQMRICMYNSILLIAVTGLIYYYSSYAMGSCETTFDLASAFPIVAFILTMLARNAIKKDDKLVKSLDRIR